ncbi:MAG TPA: hypothetical protein VHW70_07455 [Edaphobacter sp.]|nr:hypothetical protein [Edaphobacter sp.]
MNSKTSSSNDLLCPIQSLFNLVYLTMQNSDNQHQVEKYMAMADMELLRLSEAALQIVLPGTRFVDGASDED